MPTNNTAIVLSFSDVELRTLVEEYIAQQKSEFTFKGLCSYVLYWAMEDGKMANPDKAMLPNYELQPSDQERVKSKLDAIIHDGRIAVSGDTYHKH